MFETKREILIKNMKSYHEKYYKEAVFSGPSLYFHIKSLSLSNQNESGNFADSCYATLATWGMHRMGTGGSKMVNFEVFDNTVKLMWPKIKILQSKYPNELIESDWFLLKEIFSTIKVMESRTSLVGNSKVMAHALPNLVPPIDRQYTLTLLYGNGIIVNDIEKEWNSLREILMNYFYPISKDKDFISVSDEWMTNREKYKWDTSRLKIIDNLIIGYMKLKNKL
jgi:hypothetical protein